VRGGAEQLVQGRELGRHREALAETLLEQTGEISIHNHVSPGSCPTDEEE
jgi:hypothetical protein